MDADGAVQEQDVMDGDATSIEDGRTRCAWVRDRAEHYFFHDAEWGRLPDADAACFERVLLACFERETALVDVLDQRLDIFEAFAEWDCATVADADDGALGGLADRGGVFSDRGRLGWLRDVAKACVAVGKEFKGLRAYFLAMPALTPEEQISDVCARLPGFEKVDAARLIQMVGCVGGSIEQLSHERDCWIY